MDWKEMMKGKLFICDIGENFEATISGKQENIGRYSVFSPVTNSENHQIIEVGNDLKVLCEKYKIPEERVCVLSAD